MVCIYNLYVGEDYLNEALCKSRIRIIANFKDGVFPGSGHRGRGNYAQRT